MTNVKTFLILIIEGKRRYNLKTWKAFTDLFNWMPVAATIDDKIFCVHGGLSPELNSIDQITKIMRPTEVPSSGKVNFFKNVSIID